MLLNGTGSEHRDKRITRALELQARAVHANVTGHATRGASLLRRALGLLDNSTDHNRRDCRPDRCRAIARVHATLAKSLVEVDGYLSALAEMDRAQDWARCLNDAQFDAFLTSQRALILFRGGSLDAAEQSFNQAATDLDQWSTDFLRLLLNRGALSVEIGKTDIARDDLNRAIMLARALNNPLLEHCALHNLGCLQFTIGNLANSLQLMQQALDIDGLTQEGLTHLDRSRVLLAAGLKEDAAAALSQAAELFRRDRCWQDLAEVNLTRAEVALQTDQIVEARKLAAKARDRFRRHGNDRWRRVAELTLLSADHADHRPPGRLLPPALRLADEFSAAGFPQQARAATLLAAELELDRGHGLEATQLLRQAGTLSPTDPITLRLQAKLIRARSQQQRGQLASARREVVRGLQDLATYQAQFGGLDLQSASAVHGRQLVELDLDLAVSSGRPTSVIAAVERSRAVAGRIQPVTPPADSQTAEKLAELRRATEASAASSQSRSTTAEAQRRHITALQAELRSRSWLNTGSRALRSPVRIAELRAAAANDDCHLVLLIVARGRIGAITISPGRPARQIELAEVANVQTWQRRMIADLDLLAGNNLPQPLATAATNSARRGAAEIGALLAAAFPADQRPVVVSPPAELLALPWNLLPPLADRPMTVSPSLSNWHRGRERLHRARTAGSHAALNAAADSSSDQWTMVSAAGPGLAVALNEAAIVAQIWADRANARQLPDATPADLLAAMAGSRLVHVAAHGSHHSQNPMFSSLSLTGGPLFAYELDQREQLPEHIVLSACDVGRSSVRSGQETLGLTSVLLQVGTPTVVAGVAQVNDQLAAEIMEHYHGALSRGHDSAVALCLANQSVTQPSPFVCFGTPWRT